jgi:hypothetical protein
MVTLVLPISFALRHGLRIALHLCISLGVSFIFLSVFD